MVGEEGMQEVTYTVIVRKCKKFLSGSPTRGVKFPNKLLTLMSQTFLRDDVN